MKKIITNSNQETFDLGKSFSKKLKPGMVLGLVGDLGAGKTAFTKGIALGLGIKNKVNSPTFSLIKLYKIKNKGTSPSLSGSIKKAKISLLIHADIYRLEDIKEIKNIGLEEYFDYPGAVIIIEWADRVKNILPRKTKFIEITRKEENKRIFKFF